MRRVRTERLLVVTPDGATVELASAGRTVGVVDSQDELAVSPDGAYLAWTTAEDERLHLRDAHGHERILDRSPPTAASKKSLAFAKDGSLTFAIGRELVAWDPAKGRRVVLARAPEGQRIVAATATADGYLLATASSGS